MNKTLIASIIFLAFFIFQTAFGQNTIDKRNKIQICTGGVVNSKATYFPQPEYPKEAKEKGIFGEVKVRITIDEEGNVASAKVCAGHSLLRLGVEEAALKAKFEPTKLSGQPVKVSGMLIYNFVQDKSDQSKQITEEPQTNFEPTTIHFGIINDKAISLPEPNYPKELLQGNKQENVNVKVKIHLQEGRVVSAMDTSKNSSLGKYAVKAAMSAEFNPIKIEGSPLYATGLIVYKFPLTANEKNEPKKDVLQLPLFVGGIVNAKAKYLPKPVYSLTQVASY